MEPPSTPTAIAVHTDDPVASDPADDPSHRRSPGVGTTGVTRGR